MDNQVEILFFKQSGKYYSSGMLDMGPVEPWHSTEDKVKWIRDHQEVLISGFMDYDVLLLDTRKNNEDPEYQKCWVTLLKAEVMDKQFKAPVMNAHMPHFEVSDELKCPCGRKVKVTFE